MLWEHLVNGRSQLRLEPNPAAPGRSVAIGRLNDEGERLLDDHPQRVRERWSREQKLHLTSVLLARADAKLDREKVARPERVGIFDGTSRANLEYLIERLERRREGQPWGRTELTVAMPNHAAPLAASHLGLRGPACTFSAACASGAVAIGYAQRAIERGELDVAYATGHDTPLLAPVYETYHEAGVLNYDPKSAATALRPFVEPEGTVFGEGSVTLVLESYEHAAKRGVQPMATIVDFAHGNNGVHPIHVDASGESPARLISTMLERSGIAPQDLTFVVGHANGTAQTYASETALMKNLFGTRAASIPLLSTKPIFGHLMGGASALDVAAAVLMVHHGRTFSTINTDHDRVPEGMCHRAVDFMAGRARRGLATSYGMGGQMSAVLVENPAASL
jgi:3-oxoacyl-[acyl-carrier-protein] synthase II